MYGLAQGKGSI